MRYLLLALLLSILSVPGSAQALDQVNFNVVMPDLTCGKGEQLPNECTVSGRMSARGPQTLNGPVRYYCDIRYTYVAAGSENQEIRFNGRVMLHSELTVTNGRGSQMLEAPVTINLSQKARRIELAEISCYQERK